MQTNTLNIRNHSLDALRGIAILLMVLSGSIAFGGVLPGWMYHAQVPPPAHTFNPEIPGITWVDLVFPFFLFSMGVAIPLSLKKWEGKPQATPQVWWVAGRRFILLTWFALFCYHLRAWVISGSPGNWEYLLSIVAFFLLFAEFYKTPAGSKHVKLFAFIRIAAFLISAFLLYTLPFHNGSGFQFAKSDIIILVLGNMAFFGTITWWHTRHNRLLRVGILPFIMAVFLAGKTEGTWINWVFNWSPLPWMYKFYYLKYLFIIIPGTIAGDWLTEKRNTGIAPGVHLVSGLLMLGAIVINLSLLYNRLLLVNLIVSALLIAWVYFLLRKNRDSLSFGLFSMGSYLLLLGLFFEAWEGGIKKDPSTYSYYFVTTGLACYLLVFFYGWAQTRAGNIISRYLASNGQNPMVAYVAGSLLLTPLLHLTHLQQWLDLMNRTAVTGFLKGILYTAIVSVITWFFTEKKWFWKS